MGLADPPRDFENEMPSRSWPDDLFGSSFVSAYHLSISFLQKQTAAELAVAEASELASKF